MASIRKRGNSYLLVVSMGYTPDGRRRNPQQKTVKPPTGLTPKQTEKWLQEQAMLFEIQRQHAGACAIGDHTDISAQRHIGNCRCLLFRRFVIM